MSGFVQHTTTTCFTLADQHYPVLEGSEESVVNRRREREQDVIHLPFVSQHEIVVHLQKYLERVCFIYGQAKMPGVLRKHGWRCAEAVQLSTWMDEFSRGQHTFSAVSDEHDKDDDDEDLQELFQAVTKIRDTAVNRTAVDICAIRTFVTDAARLVKVLDVEPHRDLINKLRLGIVEVVDELGQKGRMFRAQGEKRLAKIAQERARLDEEERNVLAKMGQDLCECRKSAESAVGKVLDEAEKTFR